MGELATLGPYTLSRRLGVGGMAEVWEATHAQRPDARVALKRMLSDTPSSALRSKFMDEARIGSLLDHPHIVKLLDVGMERQTLYLVMELLEGQSLSQARGEGQALPIGLAVTLALQALEGLAHAHAASVIHRDIKPSNLFLTLGGDLKLIDFGIATSIGLERTFTKTGMFRGSLPYSSPEQARNEPADAQTDLFSFGLVLHELLTGRRVFDQSGEAAIVSALLWSPLPPVRSRREDVPRALERAVAWALEKERSRRAPSAVALAAALRDSVAPDVPWSRERVATWARQAQPRSSPGVARRPRPVPVDTATHDGAHAAEDETRPLLVPPAEVVSAQPVGPWPEDASGPTVLREQAWIEDATVSPPVAEPPADEEVTLALQAASLRGVSEAEVLVALAAASPNEGSGTQAGARLPEAVPGARGMEANGARASTGQALRGGSGRETAGVRPPTPEAVATRDEAALSQLSLAAGSGGAPLELRLIAAPRTEVLRAGVSPAQHAQRARRRLLFVAPLAGVAVIALVFGVVSSRPADASAAPGAPVVAAPPAVEPVPLEPGDGPEVAADELEPKLPKRATQVKKRPLKAVRTLEAGGWVTVDSRPTWARIVIDGKDLGPTPVYRHRVAAGRHLVEAVRNDGAKQRRTVKIADGREEKLVLDW